jgi:predicted RNA-binding protein with PIN domain
VIVFVDAYNVLKTMHGTDYMLPREAHAFVRAAWLRAQERGYQVVMVFDGGEGSRPTMYVESGMKIVYSGVYQTADDILLELIEKTGSGDVVLVTADRSLRRRGLQIGAQSVDPITYWRAVYTPCMPNNEDAGESVRADVPPRIDMSKDYTLEELKHIAFMTACPYKCDDINRRDRRSVADRKSKAVKKFQKIKDKL